MLGHVASLSHVVVHSPSGHAEPDRQWSLQSAFTSQRAPNSRETSELLHADTAAITASAVFTPSKLPQSDRASYPPRRRRFIPAASASAATNASPARGDVRARIASGAS